MSHFDKIEIILAFKVFGFVMKLVKHFKYKILMEVIYSTLVRSILEYGIVL